MDVAAAIAELDELQKYVEKWYTRTAQDSAATHAKFSSQLKVLEAFVTNGGSTSSNSAATASHHAAASSRAKPNVMLDWETITPTGTPSRMPQDSGTPSMASPPVSHAIRYDAIFDEVMGARKQQQQRGGGAAPPPQMNVSTESDVRSRPTPESVGADPSQALVADRMVPCQVLVEFKRKRTLQFESPYYVAVGEHVVVGGDRGEDIGLVTHSWPHGQRSDPHRPIANLGLGKVLRVANVLEISQLQGVQTELEMRAVELAQEKAAEHQLPMRIVDAEYQFDRKKLTFYYQSQHRLDFRELVRDLYKSFRARIWMEQDGA